MKKLNLLPRWLFNSLFIVLSYSLLLQDIVQSFNLENRLPIVKLGDANSYFGYSVAEHIQQSSPYGPETKW